LTKIWVRKVGILIIKKGEIIMVNEILITYYDREWGKRNGIEPQKVKDSLKMIREVAIETNHSLDVVEDTFLKLYHGIE